MGLDAGLRRFRCRRIYKVLGFSGFGLTIWSLPHLDFNGCQTCMVELHTSIVLHSIFMTFISHITSNHITSHHITSHHIISYHIISYHIISYHHHHHHPIIYHRYRHRHHHSHRIHTYKIIYIDIYIYIYIYNRLRHINRYNPKK